MAKFMIGVTGRFMKMYTDCRRNALVLIAACVFLSEYPAGQVIAAEPQARRMIVTSAAFARAGNGAARLIVRRIPDLGRYVWVQLYADGVAIANIGYGQTYEGVLPPGRHVLSVLPTPDPKWPTPWPLVLDVRSGQTYTFTAIGNSGHLILKAPGGLEIPRGR
jgi:hypothetical protein